MKFTLVSTLLAGLLATSSYVFADENNMHYFSVPGPDSEFTTTDRIDFTTNGITNDADETIIAKLYNAADNTEVKQIGSYTGEGIVRYDDSEDWSFSWVVDVPPGTYYVRLWEQDADGDIDDDDEWDNEIRSHDFMIREAPVEKKRRKRAYFRRSASLIQKAQALKKEKQSAS